MKRLGIHETFNKQLYVLLQKIRAAPNIESCKFYFEDYLRLMNFVPYTLETDRIVFSNFSYLPYLIELRTALCRIILLG